MKYLNFIFFTILFCCYYACMYIYADAFGDGVTGSCELPDVVLRTTLWSSEYQYELLTAEPCLQPTRFIC